MEEDHRENDRYGRSVLFEICHPLEQLIANLLRAALTAYVYRMCLEYARLWADDRDSMAFKL